MLHVSLRIVPFSDGLLPQAGELLARRHQRDRVVFPGLPARFEGPAVARKAIKATLHRGQAGGFAALENGRLVAYLIGDMVIDNLWSRSGWVRTPGCAHAPDVSVEAIRDLYAALGARWVGYGVFFHFVLIPVTDPALVQAWFSLSFGIEQVHALADLEVISRATSSVLPEIEIRKAGAGDRQHLAEMSDVIWKTQVQAPAWGVMMPETVGENVAGWSELVDRADVTVWLALAGSRVVGVQGYWPAEQADDNLLIPEECAHMSVAGTREEARGKGIGTLLTNHGLVQARVAGYRFCETDWRSTNLLASRFWPRQGFCPVAYRLVRRIDQRIAWADGSVPE
jgi:ribosomal protein S18 acetylase RimI-like enzyme